MYTRCSDCISLPRNSNYFYLLSVRYIYFLAIRARPRRITSALPVAVALIDPLGMGAISWSTGMLAQSKYSTSCPCRDTSRGPQLLDWIALAGILTMSNNSPNWKQASAATRITSTTTATTSVVCEMTEYDRLIQRAFGHCKFLQMQWQ